MKFLFLGIIGILLILIIIREINTFRVKALWESVRDECEQKGLSFNFSDIIPDPVPEDKNFAYVAALKPLLEYEEDGVTPLDPEKYEQLSEWASKKNVAMKELIEDAKLINQLESDGEFKNAVGEFTHEDIVKSLKAPSQDPRTEFKTTEFRKDIRNIDDLTPGEWYTGIVTNITKFGAFVDVGIKENGLVHVSEMADHFVSDALEVLKVGQEVKARVIEVDLDRKRIALSLKTGESKGVTGTKGQSQHRGNRGSKPQNQVPKQKDAPLRNNAFAALKNLKL